ncbi:MgtC/SapB family protein [Parablastomonas sp. CN1-191]|uniref:MgtC/SapB family protein n=1 Tax=Parablastomonas sp. CN1-191 TaxID=3400908 RepID=UPI003BF8E40B
MPDSLILGGLAGAACGLMIGIERGWQQRGARSGSRISGVRTFTLVGLLGGLSAVIAQALSAAIATVIVAIVASALAAAYVRELARARRRDATTFVAAMLTLVLGLLAGAGFPGPAMAAAGAVTLLLATRKQSHRLVAAMSATEVSAFAQFTVLAAAVLPFLPDRAMGPYGAWNPFRLWLVVLIVIAFSIAGYVANRLFGERRGTLATALIGGAYSSTAVTAALSARLGADEPGPHATGIALATAVMYCRVLILTAILAPAALVPLALLVAPAALIAWLAAGILWRRERALPPARRSEQGPPFQLRSALGFAALTAAATLCVRWAEAQMGELGAAVSLFLAGSLDVDAAIVTLSSLPAAELRAALGALALGGTVAVNMAVKIGVVIANAGRMGGRAAALALLSSELALIAALGVRFLIL